MIVVGAGTLIYVVDKDDPRGARERRALKRDTGAGGRSR